MEFYLYLFSLVSLGSVFHFFRLEDRIKKTIFLSFIALFIFISSIRWCNTDWEMYYNFFTSCSTIDEFTSWGIDPGYGVLNFLVKQIYDSYSFFYFVIAVILIGIKARFILAYSAVPLLSLLVWFGIYVGDIFFVRQTLAVTLTLVSFYFITKKKKIPFVLTTLLAATQQISVIAFLVAYPIYHMRLKQVHLFLMLVASLIIGRLLTPDTLLWLGTVLGVFSADGMERIATKVLLYSSSDGDSSFIIFGYIRRLIFIPFELYFMNKMVRFDSRYRGYTRLIIFGYSLYFLLSGMSSTLAMRISVAFYIYEIITIPELILMFKGLYSKLVAYVVLFAYALVKYVYIVHVYEDSYIPFKSILF